MNTLKYAKRMEEVGFSREQAEMTVGILSEVMEGNLATKHGVEKLEFALRSDMESLETSLRGDMEKLETSLRGDMEKLGTSLRNDIQHLKSDLIIKLGAMMVTGIAVISALIKIL